MNLEEALAKEGELRTRMLAAIASQHQLDPKSAGKLDGCMLGDWLHGEGERKFPFVKSFQPAVDAHAAFHAEVEKVVRQINLGEYDQAKAMLGNGTPCTRAFVNMVAAVRQLKADARL
ncbi:MAG TPA: CZB domain-containing protein [Noviherbaspirillum sp.]|uniref:CZB domain-containing protein n=1 Tax=Noviherbaspirillum sp. TaxID=1926288 RepID=UPI002D44C06E|nr:CZB domain-containing protein [Noviherbaspirillum sp.]HYD94505.1 CZB domain-containing protein [Noviherbaspirillum sp.]